MDPLVPNQVRYRAAPHSEDQDNTDRYSIRSRVRQNFPQIIYAPAGPSRFDAKKVCDTGRQFSLTGCENMTALPFSYSSHDYPGPARRHHIVLGAGVLLLHVAFLYGWRYAKPPPLPDSGPKVESITVWIRPPKPIIKALRHRRPWPGWRRNASKKPLRAAAPPKTAPAAPAADSVPNAITVAPSPTPADPLATDAPKFDMEAALSTARKMASETRPGQGRHGGRPDSRQAAAHGNPAGARYRQWQARRLPHRLCGCRAAGTVGDAAG